MNTDLQRRENERTSSVSALCMQLRSISANNTPARRARRIGEEARRLRCLAYERCALDKVVEEILFTHAVGTRSFAEARR